MNNPNTSTCPKCGTSIPSDAPGGLCPKCVLEGVAASGTKTTVAGGKSTPPPSIDELSPHFKDLEFIELLGAGGMGAVYKARQPNLDRIVAVKILSHHLADDPAFVERFNREARVLAKLSHPNIVGIFDFGTAGPYCYLIMEYVDGVNLRQAMRAGGFTTFESLALVLEICSALKFAHEEGILHRDIKPENVLIDSKGRVKIADFGIAKMIGEGDRQDITLTMQGSILGSPHYMAPEQFESPEDVDQRADIYSLGVVLYEMLTGELPIGRFALPSEKKAMDTRIDEIVLRTLEKERQARFQSADEITAHVNALTKSIAPAVSQALSQKEMNTSGVARFSLVSALTTGVGLVLGLVLVWAGVYVQDETRTEVGDAVGILVTILGYASWAVTAVVGTILGSKALSEIRASGGKLGGLRSAAFGTMTWPILLAAILSLMTLMMPLKVTGHSSVAYPIIFLILFIVIVVASFIMIRGIARWAKGVDDGNGAKRHPRFLVSLLLGLLTAMLLPSAILLVFGSILPEDERVKEVERRMEEMKKMYEDEERDTVFGSEANWIMDGPEVTIDVDTSSSVSASFELVEVDYRTGKTIYHYLFLREKAVVEGDPLFRSTFKIGSSNINHGHGGDGGPAASKSSPGVTVLVEEDGDKVSFGALVDMEEWDFNDDYPSEIVLDSPGKREIKLADEFNGFGTLTLLITVD